MEQFKQRPKLLSYFLGLGVIILFNCFGFPIINLNKEWPMMLTATKIYVVLGSALFSGGILAGLFPKKKTSLDKGTQRKTTENELPSLTQCTA